MAAITKKSAAFWALLILIVAVISFSIGRNYQELVSMYDQYALFMNLSGDYINEFNETLGALDTEEAKAVLHSLNQRVVNDFGCSPWIHHISDMDDHNLEVFKSAVKRAFDSSGSEESLNEECLENLRHQGLLR